jgi:predicted PurR-regulated permease PerM
VWDLPRITNGVKALENSAISFAYKEVAPPVKAFGNLVAQCFETQAVIALVNCVLTTLGLYTLKISGLGFFSLLTFVASFIPVAGIFIATIPPLVVAATEQGLGTCVKLIAMVAGVHAVEAYLLYPQIYAYRLKLHPLIVLSALVTAEHFAGVQGLFLAMPITLYLLKQVLFPVPTDTKKIELVQQPTNLFSKS